ncbi:MAG: hypothetical protein CBD18_01900 [Opitutales bacterium TMED158]|nr:MAG: hypothetical protein CBD18_01900 [Opitutales bacterium TMED158]
MLKVENLSKEYPGPAGTVSVLNELNLSVGKGESVAIVGPSGCGKTTLLNILGTLDLPTAGKVEIGGRSVASMSNEQRSRFRNRSLGFVFQQHFLLPQCTVLENVLMPRLAGGWEETEEATRERAQALLEGLGLSHRSTHMPYQLSGGERLRVAVARSLVNEPALVLADEPTGSLDPAMGEQVADLFAALSAQHDVTLVTVTHNMALAERMGIVYRLDGGRLEAQ